MSTINRIKRQAKFGAIANGRRVILRGTTSLGWYYGDWATDTDATVQRIVSNALRSAGFEVVAVRTQRVSFLSAAPWPVNLEIELEVYCNYSGDEARNNAITVIEGAQGFATSLSTSPSKIFQNTTLTVANDQGCTNQPAQNTPALNPSAYDQSQAVNSNSGWDSFWRGIGISTVPTIGTVALVGVAYLVISGKAKR